MKKHFFDVSIVLDEDHDIVLKSWCEFLDVKPNDFINILLLKSLDTLPNSLKGGIKSL